jgi:transportin-1
MCLWALEQTSEFIVETDGELGFLRRSMTAILTYMRASTKILQTSAVTALGTFAECCENEELHPYLVDILTVMAECFSGYQLKNLYSLFEEADTVYQCFGRRLAQDDVIQLMMTPLMTMWDGIENDSPLIFPFFMAMASACSAIGGAIEPMALSIFQRAFQMVEYHQSQRLAAVRAGESMPDYSQEFLVAGLDLLSGLCGAMGSGIQPYIMEVGVNGMVQLILTTGGDKSPEIRQSALAVLGELCGGCIGFVQANWGVFGPLLGNSLTEIEHFTVASNAAWALSDFLANYTESQGLPSLQMGDIDLFYYNLAQLLVSVHDGQMRMMRENAAIAMGRLLALDPSVVQRQQVPFFYGDFCSTLAPIASKSANVESALRGALQQWSANPALLADCPSQFLDLLAGLPTNMPTDLRQELRQLVGALKQGMGQTWAAAVNSLNQQQLRAKLQREFGA